jgi:hypothetical protein
VTEAGRAPDAEKAKALIRANDFPREWIRLYRWSGVLPAAGLEHWKPVLESLNAKYGAPDRGLIEEKQFAEFGSVENPFSVDELRKMSPPDLMTFAREWRPTRDSWRASASDLASSVTEVMKTDLATWTADPVDVATQLRHPTYVQAYLDLLAVSHAESAASIAALIDLVVLVFSEPWVVEPIGDIDRQNYDPTWQWCQDAALRLVDHLARDDAQLDARMDELVSLLCELSFAGTEDYVPEKEDAYTRAINHAPSVAFSTLFSVALNDFRMNASIRRSISDAFTRALDVPGPAGEELRAVLATHLPQLHTCAPGWLDEHMDALLDGPLGQPALDMALKWGSFSSVLMENHAKQVWHSVGQQIENAIDKVMLALMNGLAGWEPVKVVERLGDRQELSAGGKAAARILNNSGDVPQSVVDNVTEYWRLSNESKRPESLSGFGWFALAEQIPDDVFARLLLKTLERMNEPLDFSYQVAERLSKVVPDETVLACWDYLVRLRSEAFDQQNVVSRAIDALAATPTALQTHASYRKLRSTLQERDAI